MSLPFDHLSASSLNSFGGYASCELAWYYRYLERLPMKPRNIGMLGGLAWDRSCNAAADYKIREHKNPPADLASEAFIEKWDEEIALGEYVDPEEMSQVWLNRGEKAARRYATDVVPQLEPVVTQKRVETAFEEVDWTIVGYIDLVSTARGGKLVLDNKATANPRRNYDEALAANDLQLGIYDVALTAEGEKVVGRGFLSAKLLKTKQELRAAVVESSPSQRATTMRLLGDMSGRIESACETGAFLPTAYLTNSWRCSRKFCDWYDVCPYGARARVAVPLPGIDIPPSPQEQAIAAKTAAKLGTTEKFNEASEALSKEDAA